VQQQAIPVLYDGVAVGHYLADLLVENTVVIELKAARSIDDIHEAQLLNYLRATGLRLGLILNFGTPKLGIRRMVL
jgi:GxxExxY protein